MNTKMIAATLAGLTGGALVFACDKADPPATEVPAATEPAPGAAEHACGNHAEGACAGDAKGEVDPSAAAATTAAFTIDPGKFAEANFKMAKGSKVTITFAEGSAEIAWDVHSHDHEGGTKIHEQGKGGTGTVDFVAPSDGVFS